MARPLAAVSQVAVAARPSVELQQVGQVHHLPFSGRTIHHVHAQRGRLTISFRKAFNGSPVYTPVQMRALFERQGLIVEQVHRSLVFEAYGKAVPRMVLGGGKVPTRAKTVQRTGASRYGQRQRKHHPRRVKSNVNSEVAKFVHFILRQSLFSLPTFNHTPRGQGVSCRCLTGLEKVVGSWFYKDVAPTALGAARGC